MIIGPAAIGAGAALLGTLMGGWLQGRRDDRRWRRQQVATAYAEAQNLLTGVMRKACLAFDERIRGEKRQYGTLVDEAVRLAEELNAGMDRVQLVGSKRVCDVVARIMPGAVEQVLIALDITTELTDSKARQLCTDGMYALRDFTDACRRDLGIKGRSAYEPVDDVGGQAA